MSGGTSFPRYLGPVGHNILDISVLRTQFPTNKFSYNTISQLKNTELGLSG